MVTWQEVLSVRMVGMMSGGGSPRMVEIRCYMMDVDDKMKANLDLAKSKDSPNVEAVIARSLSYNVLVTFHAGYQAKRHRV